jgi:hypothetical protein
MDQVHWHANLEKDIFIYQEHQESKLAGFKAIALCFWWFFASSRANPVLGRCFFSSLVSFYIILVFEAKRLEDNCRVVFVVVLMLMDGEFI